MVTKVKMEVTPDLSRRVQEIVFNNGGKWKAGNVNINNTLFPYLYLDENKLLTFESKYCKEDFKKCEFEEISAYDFIASQGEQKWLPQFGERVEFSDNGKRWYKEHFISYTPHCLNEILPYRTLEGSFFEYCRPIKQTKTIIINGKNIEISKESFESLKEQLLKN